MDAQDIISALRSEIAPLTDRLDRIERGASPAAAPVSAGGFTGAAIEAMTTELATVVKEHLAEVLDPLRKRLDLVEARPVVKYYGVWEHGTEYAHGSLVTRNGSLWHANETTKDKPGDPSGAWTMTIKSGAFKDAP